MGIKVPELRSYQKEVVNRLYDQIRKGNRSPLLVLPTGAGKTVTSSHLIASSVEKGRKVLFVVHREALVGQAAATLESFGLRVGVLKSGYPDYPDLCSVLVIGLQTYAARGGVARFLSDTDKALIVFDECHTTRWWTSSRRLVEDVGSRVQSLIELGLTATPYRLKKKEYFGEFYDSVVKGLTVRELQKINESNPRSGLVKFSYKGWGGFKGFDELRVTSSGDYSQADIEKAALNQEFLDESVKKLVEITDESPRVERVACFCSSHKQVEEIKARLETAGKTVGVVLGDTPLTDRDELYSAFADGSLQFMLGCGCFSEGWDCPPCNSIALFRPTASRALYVQIVGRAARPFVNSITGEVKTYALVLDFTNTVSKLGYLEDISEEPVELAPPVTLSDDREPNTKDCPECGATIRSNAPVCPECGHIFNEDEEPFVKPVRKPVLRGFGAILPEKRRKVILKLRKKRFDLYRDKKDPGKLYSKGLDPSSEGRHCLYRTIYGGSPTAAQYYDFTEYLLRFSNHPVYLDWHLTAEFGTGEYSEELQVLQPTYEPTYPYKPYTFWLGLSSPGDITEFEKLSLQSRLEYATPRLREVADDDPSFDEVISWVLYKLGAPSTSEAPTAEISP